MSAQDPKAPPHTAIRCTRFVLARAGGVPAKESASEIFIDIAG
jgi:hypothetical protein